MPQIPRVKSPGGRSCLFPWVCVLNGLQPHPPSAGRHFPHGPSDTGSQSGWAQSSCSCSQRSELSEERSRSPSPTGALGSLPPQAAEAAEKGVVPTLRTKWSFWFPVSLFIALTCTPSRVPAPSVVKMWIPCVEQEEAGQRRRQFSLRHTVVIQGERAQCLCTCSQP